MRKTDEIAKSQEDIAFKPPTLGGTNRGLYGKVIGLTVAIIFDLEMEVRLGKCSQREDISHLESLQPQSTHMRTTVKGVLTTLEPATGVCLKTRFFFDIKHELSGAKPVDVGMATLNL